LVNVNAASINLGKVNQTFATESGTPDVAFGYATGLSTVSDRNFIQAPIVLIFGCDDENVRATAVNNSQATHARDCLGCPPAVAV
jgi:hypothetical protein